MTELPGPAAVLRYTDAEEFVAVPRGDWWPADVDDFQDEITDAVGGTAAEVVVEARVDTGDCPDVELCAAVVLLAHAPWGAPDEAALVILGDGELTVLSYPDRAAARTGFDAHVAARQSAGDPYDYVSVPGRRRTAYPPSGYGREGGLP